MTLEELEALTIVSMWSTRSQINEQGNVEYTTTHPRPEHLEFYYVDNDDEKKLMLGNAEVRDISLNDDQGLLIIREHLVHGEYVSEYHLHSSSKVALQRFLEKEKKGG